MFALGGEYTTLVGCSNPFSGLPETSPHILSSTLFLEPPVGQPSEEGAEGWQEAKDAAEPVSTVKPEEDKEASTDNKKSDDVDNEEDKKEK
ncbi:hypothetical protein AGDE_12944 [Angomonas deanei]|nr:hypothetical protein AGDE_12944 [Angomonas deanei]|eukprot:EPY23216.1 hypothetical protein AGDE_12944 [Angomonas deanei]